jgi:glycosyltransferase involved in cell wall biosynthesis
MTPASVSVVVPCYNAADTVLRALESVRAQTRAVHEIICVNDASTDATARVIEQFKNATPALRVQTIDLERNSGPSHARNRGWDLARGDYIAFLDADDAWDPQKIALQYEWMQQHPQIALCGHAHLTSQARVEVPALPPRPVTVYQITPKEILLSNPFVSSAVMLRRALPHRFDPTRRYTEDYLLWMQICLDGNQVALLDAPLAFVFREPGTLHLSQNLLQMRNGDIENYWRLWRAHKINLLQLILLIPFSLLKFLLLLTFPRAHSAIKRRLFVKPFEETRRAG